MIPKIVHYCWFGKNEYPDLVRKCISSWKELLPDYEIVCWNEDNFDISCNKYVKEAYEKKQYAFVTDYVRLYVLYNFGGIYMDTDVEVIKNLDIFLQNKAFSGFESKEYVQTGIMGSERGNKCIKYLLEYYTNKRFILPNGDYDITTNVIIITKLMTARGLKLNNKEQTVFDYKLYPNYYFCPNSLLQVFGLKPLNKNTYTIHHFGGGWRIDGKKVQPFTFRLKRYIVNKIRFIFGEKITANIAKHIRKNHNDKS